MTRPQTAQASHRIALLFNANKVYDRGVITGIGNYLLSTRVAWDLFLEEDFRCRLTGPLDPAGEAIGAAPLAGQWRWHQGAPPDLLAVQSQYARFF